MTKLFQFSSFSGLCFNLDLHVLQLKKKVDILIQYKLKIQFFYTI